MRFSPFFRDLSSSYAYEIEDLTWDSGGANVLASRLRTRREQFDQLLPMSEFDPVMVATVFRGGFRFGEKEVSQGVFAQLLSAKPGQFPSWSSLAGKIRLEPWAGELAERALRAPGGEQFLLIAAGLEYIFSGNGAAPAAVEAEMAGSAGAGDDGRDSDEDDGAQTDLAEAGEDYLSEQGFDRRN